MNAIPARLYEDVKNIFSRLSPRVRWTSVLLATALVIGLLLLLESLIGPVYHWQLQTRISLLHDLNSLAQEGVTEKPELAPIYAQLVDELADRQYLSLTTSASVLGENLRALVRTGLSSELFWKIFAGSLLGLLVAWSGRNDLKKGKEGAQNTIYGGLFFAVVGGLIGLFLPIIWNLIVHVIVVPIAYGIIIYLLGRITSA